MKHLLIIFSLLLTSVVWSEDYIIDNNGKRTIITEHYYNDKSFFRAFKIEGSFTDNIGNYGNWNSFVTTYVTDGKVTKLDFSNQFKFQNKKKFYLQGFRQEGTDAGGGGIFQIIAGIGEFKGLVGKNCNYALAATENFTVMQDVICKP